MKNYYHIIFPTYRRKSIFFNDFLFVNIVEILFKIFDEKNIKVITFKILSDHAHFLIKLGKHQELSWIIKLIKGISTYKFYKRLPEIKNDIGRGRIWAKGYRYEKIENEFQFYNTIKYILNNKDKYRKRD